MDQMNESGARSRLDAVLQEMWRVPDSHQLSSLLPRTVVEIDGTYEKLQRWFDGCPRGRRGSIHSGAEIDGDVVFMGKRSVIEAGVVLDETCRLYLGEGSRVRSGAFLRGEVIVGEGCVVGGNCEIARSVLVGPNTNLAHLAFLADSIAGPEVNLAGGCIVANVAHRKDRGVEIRWGAEKIATARSHMGLLAGAGCLLGAATVVCPGTVILPGLSLPPGALLLGVVDQHRRRRLWASFYERCA